MLAITSEDLAPSKWMLVSSACQSGPSIRNQLYLAQLWVSCSNFDRSSVQVIDAAKREIREEVVAAGVVGRLERIMRILPVIQEAALASRDLAR